MVIENKKSTIGVQVRRLLFIIILATVVTLLFYIEAFRDAFLGIDRSAYIIGLIVLYFMYYLWGVVRDYHFIYYNDLGAKLLLKYYSLAPLSKRQRSIEIDKVSFYKFEFRKKWFGLRQYVILHQRVTGGVAKYPPISLGLLTNVQIENLRKSLELFKKLNRPIKEADPCPKIC